MPGLSQLKKFNEDIISLGNELTLRSGRGEKPVRVPIPDDIPDVDDSEDFVAGMPETEAPAQPADADAEDVSEIAEVSAEGPESAAPSSAPDMSDLLNPIDSGSDSDSGMPDLSMFMDEPAAESVPEPQGEEVSVADMGLDALLAGTGFDGSTGTAEDSGLSGDFDSLDDLPDFPGEEASAPAAPVDLGLDGFDTGDLPDVSGETETSSEPPADNFGLDDLNLDDMDFGSLDTPVDSATEPIGGTADSPDFGDFGLDDMDFGGDAAGADAAPTDGDFSPDEGTESTDATTENDGDFGLGDLNLDDMDFGGDAAGTDDASADGDFSPDEGTESGDDTTESDGDFGLGDLNLDDMDFGGDAAGTDDASADGDAALFGLGLDDIPEFEDSDDNAEPVEDFDTSGMDGLDFDIPDTDSQLGGDDGDFSLGDSSDIPMEGSDFEIPGFSDVDTAKEEKKSSAIISKSKGKAEEQLPENTLSDEQYKQFLQNLSEYPLNVRLAFENLIVQDEFTEDAEFEIIEKILNKVPARQLAASLEKMLDISIPVPRDFEHRTAAEYEAYKKSLQYQLKNRVIPIAFVGVVAMLVGWGLFNFGKNCIYEPLKANSLYKQGYALLQADEYPQADMKFTEAVKHRLSKKWFFEYARGYREHKQYQRAASMYQNILRYFKHDKIAGLEYAGMELDDLANYERAEEIVRREILDYHINSPEGILLLGDIYLEWGTEKDPSKLDLAREQYATLLQLYKPTELYYSRMMRYFIRTDNLRQVLQLRGIFDKEKSLSSADWTELSGYLLDKMYGPLAPADEYLRMQIDGLRGLLLRAVKTDPANPIAFYNLSRYYIQTNESGYVESTLKTALDRFNNAESLKTRDIYKYIDSYRLLGEYYVGTTDYLKAQEQYAEGIALYTAERDNAGFEGNQNIGHLYADLGDISYFVSGNYDEAINSYKNAVSLDYDNASIRYRIGYVQYRNKNYTEALGSFMKAGEGAEKSRNLLLAMANTLSLRNDDYAAKGYYDQLIANLDDAVAQREILFPQVNKNDFGIVSTYLQAANNYGVTLYRLAKRTGNSDFNAQAIVQFQQSVRAWDALTRNQDTLERLEGSNLAFENIKYITHSFTSYEPAIYLDIAKTLTDMEGID